MIYLKSKKKYSSKFYIQNNIYKFVIIDYRFIIQIFTVLEFLMQP